MLLCIQKISTEDQRSPRTINSNKTFTDKNLGIKKDYISIKTILTIKATTMNYSNPSIPHEENVESETLARA